MNSPKATEIQKIPFLVFFFSSSLSFIVISCFKILGLLSLQITSIETVSVFIGTGVALLWLISYNGSRRQIDGA